LDAYSTALQGKETTTLGINITVTAGTPHSAVEWYQQQQSHMFHSAHALNPLAAIGLPGTQQQPVKYPHDEDARADGVERDSARTHAERANAGVQQFRRAAAAAAQQLPAARAQSAGRSPTTLSVRLGSAGSTNVAGSSLWAGMTDKPS